MKPQQIWDVVGGKERFSFFTGAYGFKESGSSFHYSKGIAIYKGSCKFGLFRSLEISCVIEDMGEFVQTIRRPIPVKIFDTEWTVIYNKPGSTSVHYMSTYRPFDVSRLIQEVLGCELFLGPPPT